MKICNECGTQLPEDAELCPSCGAPAELPVTIEEANEVPVEETYEEVYEEVYESVPENQVLEPIMDEETYTEYEDNNVYQDYAEQEYVDQEYTEQEYVDQEYVEQETYEEPVYAEPMYTEPVAPQVQMVQPKPKSGGVPIIVVIILIILTLAVSLLIGYLVFGRKPNTEIPTPKPNEVVIPNNEKEKEEKDKDTEEQKEQKEDQKDEEKDSEDENVPATKKVVIDGYEFKIPTTLDYKADKDKLEITAKDKLWTTNIKTTSSIYSLLVDQKDELKAKFENSGYKVNEYGTKEIDGYEILLFEVTESNGYNMFLAYSYLGSARVAVYSMYSTDNKYNYEALEEVVKVVKNATPSTQSTETSNTTEELA